MFCCFNILGMQRKGLFKPIIIAASKHWVYAEETGACTERDESNHIVWTRTKISRLQRKQLTI